MNQCGDLINKQLKLRKFDNKPFFTQGVGLIFLALPSLEISFF